MTDPDPIARHVAPLAPLPTGVSPAGNLAGPVSACLFDIYGTLLISASGDVGVSRDLGLPDARLGKLLARFGVRESPSALHRRLLEAVAGEHAARRRRGADFPEVRIDRVWMKLLGEEDRGRARRFALEYELIVNPVYPMPGATALLASCRRAGIVGGIVSNAQFYTPPILRALLGAAADWGFERQLTFYSYRMGVAKPSPRLFAAARRALDERGIKADRTLFVGNDMRNDILPAAGAGMRTALFAGDRRSLRRRRSDPRCRRHRPDLVVTDLRQLAGILDRRDGG